MRVHSQRHLEGSRLTPVRKTNITKKDPGGKPARSHKTKRSVVKMATLCWDRKLRVGSGSPAPGRKRVRGRGKVTSAERSQYFVTEYSPAETGGQHQL